MCVKVLFSSFSTAIKKSSFSKLPKLLISQEENIQKEYLMKGEGTREHTVHHPSHNFKFITCIGKERILIYSLTEAPVGKGVFFSLHFALV